MKDINKLRDELSHVYWIGGVPTGGKTTASKLLEDKFKYIYHTDDHAFGQFKRARQEKHPAIIKMSTIPFSEYITLPEQEWLQLFLQYFHEGFEMILEDLLLLPRDQPILVEGGEIIPELVNEVADNNHALWMIPSKEFLSEHLVKQQWVTNIEVKYHAKLNLKYQIFRDYVYNTAKEKNLMILETTEKNSMDTNIVKIKNHFQI